MKAKKSERDRTITKYLFPTLRESYVKARLKVKVDMSANVKVKV